MSVLEKAFADGQITEICIRKPGEDLIVAEVTGNNLPLPCNATATFPQDNIVRYTLAAALNQYGIHTPDAENAKGKVLPSYGKFPL